MMKKNCELRKLYLFWTMNIQAVMSCKPKSMELLSI